MTRLAIRGAGRSVTKGAFFSTISASLLFACGNLLGLSDKSLAPSSDASSDVSHDTNASSGDATNDGDIDAKAPFVVAIDTFADGQAHPTGITLDDANVYWLSESAGTLVRRNKSAGAPIVPLATGLSTPSIVTGDAIYLYFTANNETAGDAGDDGSEDAGAFPILLGRATKDAIGDASTASVVPFFHGANADLFSDIAVFFDRHTEGGAGTDDWLFAAENASILRFNRDGTNGFDLVDPPNVVTAIDVDDTYLYFATEADSSISRMPKDGSAGASPIVEADVVDLAVDADYIYWIDPNGALYRDDKAGTTTPVLVAYGDSAPRAKLALDETFAYWTRADPDAPQNGEVLLAPKLGANATAFTVMASVNDPRGIAVDHDPATQMPIVYVTSYGDGEIERATITPSSTIDF